VVSRAAKMWMGGQEARSERSRGAARARRGRVRKERAVVVRMLVWLEGSGGCGVSEA